jgi:hypothetical protein
MTFVGVVSRDGKGRKTIVDNVPSSNSEAKAESKRLFIGRLSVCSTIERVNVFSGSVVPQCNQNISSVAKP